MSMDHNTSNLPTICTSVALYSVALRSRCNDTFILERLVWRVQRIWGGQLGGKPRNYSFLINRFKYSIIILLMNKSVHLFAFFNSNLMESTMLWWNARHTKPQFYLSGRTLYFKISCFVIHIFPSSLRITPFITRSMYWEEISRCLAGVPLGQALYMYQNSNITIWN